MIHIGRAGSNLGTFSESEVRQGLVTGRFSLTDLGWKEGMGNWAPLSQFPELTAPVPPPLPPSVTLDDDATPETPETADHAGLPWDSRLQAGSIATFAQTARMVLLNPGEAFLRMRVEGRLAGPLLYNAIGGWIGLIASALYAVLVARIQHPPPNPTQLQQMFALTPEKAILELKFVAVAGPFLVTASSVICAGIVHLLLMLTGGAKRPFHVTLRVFFFSYGSTQLLQLLPFCGSIAAPVWLMVSCIVGLAVAHGTTTGRTVATMVLFLAACGLCCIGIVFLAVGANYGALSSLTNQ